MDVIGPTATAEPADADAKAQDDADALTSQLESHKEEPDLLQQNSLGLSQTFLDLAEQQFQGSLAQSMSWTADAFGPRPPPEAPATPLADSAPDAKTDAARHPVEAAVGVQREDASRTSDSARTALCDATGLSLGGTVASYEEDFENEDGTYGEEDFDADGGDDTSDAD